jgi:hypothetical protein
MWICVGIILLDNMLKCLLFIAIIDLFRTCDSIVTLICNTLVMFMIYTWIKIKLKMLIYPTISTHLPPVKKNCAALTSTDVNATDIMLYQISVGSNQRQCYTSITDEIRWNFPISFMSDRELLHLILQSVS